MQERSAESSAIFREMAGAGLSDKDRRVLRKLEQHARETEPLPTGVIFVDCDPSLCLRRAGARGQDGDMHITAEYLSNCRDLHLRLIDRYLSRGVEVLWILIDTDGPNFDQIQLCIDWMEARTMKIPHTSDPTGCVVGVGREQIGRTGHTCLFIHVFVYDCV